MNIAREIWGRIRYRWEGHKTWRGAQTVPELGRHGAAWCRGELGAHPSGYDVPDPETVPMLPVLARANDAGFFTYQSQQGGRFEESVDGVTEAKAFVQGFLERVELEEFRCHLESAGMLVLDSMVDDEPTLRYCDREGAEVGGTWRARSESHLHHISSIARGSLADAADLYVLDVVWCRNDALWAALDRWAASRGA